MCGIVGLIKNDHKDDYWANRLFKDMVFCDQVRGRHATGVMAVTMNNTIHTYKKDLSAADFLQLADTRDLLNEKNVWGMLGHNRYATSLYRGDEHAHPFEHGKVTLVHNGVINQSWAPGVPSFDVDSEEIAWLLGNSTDYLETLSAIEGHYAVVWYDEWEESFYFARNQYRPMAIVESKYGDVTCWGSEARMVTWLMDKHGSEPDKIHHLPVGQLWRLTKYSMEPEMVGEFDAYVEPPKPVIALGPHFGGPRSTTTVGVAAGTATATPPAKQATPRREKVIAETEKFSQTNGLWAGKEVAFVIQSLTEQTYPGMEDRGKYGVMHGKPTGNHWTYEFLTKMHRVSMSRFAPGELCQATISGIEIDPDGNKVPMVWVTGIKSVDLQSPILEGTVEKSTQLPHLPHLEALDEDDITLEQFHRATKAGCCICSEAMDYDDLPEMLWTHDRQPVCCDCAEDIIENSPPLDYVSVN